MAHTVSELLISATAIVIAGSFLTRFADRVAEITGLGRLVIGSVMLAGATSLPELAIDISAVRMGMPNLAVGDLLGSSLMNLLILAVLDLSHSSQGRILSRKSAAHALAGLVSGSMAALVALGIITSKVLEPFSVAGLSPGIWVLIAGYVLGTRLIYIDTLEARRHLDVRSEGQSSPGECGQLHTALLGFGFCAASICLAGPHLARSAGDLAERSGMGDRLVGTTLVALATSLPELVSTTAALRMGAIDLAIENIFGSNAFNVLLFVPLDVLQPGSLLAVVSPKHVITCLAAILATQVAVMGQLYQAESRTKVIEPDAWLVILIVVSSLGLIYYYRS